MILESKFNFFVREGTFTTKKKKKVANNDFTGKKKVFMRGQFS